MILDAAMCSGEMSSCSAERYMDIPVIRRLRTGEEYSYSPYGARPVQFPEAPVRTAKPSRRMAQDTVAVKMKDRLQATPISFI